MRQIRNRFLTIAPIAFVSAVLAASSGAAGCGSNGTGSNFGSGDDGTHKDGGGDDGTAGDDAGDDVIDFGDGGGDGHQGCVNLQCQIANCSPGSETTVTGTVYDPGAINPLYNVIVYVPNTKPDPFKEGITCDKCGVLTSGSPVVTTLTGSDGKFSLKNVPSGQNIPLVMQIGKWRRQITIPNVTSCQETKLTDKNQTRLPKNKSEGDIPRIAITTGGCDPFECLLRNIGIADSEFGPPGSAARVHLYQGTDGFLGGSQYPGSGALATQLWGSSTTLAQYDIQINSCECSEVPQEKPQPSINNIVDYANKGGRLFTTHYHYYWIDPQIVTPGATDPWINTAQFHSETSGSTTVATTIDTSFPKGAAFADWLVVVGASTTRGSLTVNDARYNATAVNAPSLRWMYVPSPASLMHYTFNTPLGVPDDQQCGKVLFSDFHVAGSSNGNPFPQECSGNTFTPQQKALEFMLFDLSSCIQKDTQPPAPPPPK